MRQIQWTICTTFTITPATPEAGQWPDGNSLQQTGLLRELSRGRQNVRLLSNPNEGEIAEAPILMGGPIEGSHPNNWYGMQDLAEL
jgi:hypothetical protein